MALKGSEMLVTSSFCPPLSHHRFRPYSLRLSCCYSLPSRLVVDTSPLIPAVYKADPFTTVDKVRPCF